jgi:hypothetical protein
MGMTAKAWCAISKAVEMVAATQGMSKGRAQAWVIEACVTGTVRSRMPSFTKPADLAKPLNEDDLTDPRPRSRPSVFRKRSPGPISPGVWKDAVIDGDALIDADHDRRRGIEISIADLEFELKRSSSLACTSASATPIPRSGRRLSDKEPILAEAQRRLAVDESIPSSLAAFARDLHRWLSTQPWAYRRPSDRKVLSAPSIEEHIRPLWRKYKPD